MRRAAAAAWIGVSATKFDEMVKDGRMPKPKRVDGCVVWDRYRLDAAFEALPDELPKKQIQHTSNEAAVDTSQVNIIRQRLQRVINTSEQPQYNVHAYAQLQRGDITSFELPPGKYPNGMRIYADGEWEAIVRSKPMGKRERIALENYYQAKGQKTYVKGGGIVTTECLLARGFVEVIEDRGEHRSPYHGITPAGEAEWIRIVRKQDLVRE
jgi:hypothetical protein